MTLPWMCTTLGINNPNAENELSVRVAKHNTKGGRRGGDDSGLGDFKGPHYFENGLELTQCLFIF